MMLPKQADGDNHQHRGENRHQPLLRHRVRNTHTHGGERHTDRGHHGGGAIAHQFLPQALYGADSRAAGYRQQGYRHCLLHAPAQAGHQCRHRDAAAAGAGQPHDGTDQDAQG